MCVMRRDTRRPVASGYRYFLRVVAQRGLPGDGEISCRDGPMQRYNPRARQTSLPLACASFGLASCKILAAP